MAGENEAIWSAALARAPFSLLAAADRAQQAADNAWRALADHRPGK